jgi:Carboxypeptidase regulatory-like domain
MNKGSIRLICNNLARFTKLFIVLVLLALAGQSVMAQGTRGTIRGTVKDPNQAVVPNATVRLVDSKKGTEVRNVQTDSDGNYQFIEIEPSTYNLFVSAPSFSEAKITDVTVEPNRNLVLDANLTVGQVTNEVTVTAGAEIIDRESPTLGTTVENRRIVGLPLNGRNVLNLALLQPGVFPTAGTLSGLGIRVNGSRGTENNVTIDGANNNEVAVGGVIGGITRPDAVQEFRLLTSNFEAEFGRNTGSIINVVTRSGTNGYHGNARFFYRGTEHSAANFFDNALAPANLQGTDRRQPFDRKEYGFNIGGPVFFPNFGDDGPSIYNGKDRTFFFADYERRWQKLGGSVALSNLPSAAERNGDFSGLLSQGIILFDPLTATAGNPGGNPFPNNIIPANRISPIARFYLQFIPEANASGQALASNNTLSKVNYFTGRFDHNFTQNHSLNLTYNYTDSDTASGSAFGGTNIPGFGSTDLRKAQNVVGRYTAVISSNVVNTFLLGYARNDQPGVAPVNQTTPSQIGFTGAFVANGQFAGPPFIQFYDRGFTLGNTIQGPQVRLSENFQVQDSLSWIVGNHRFKFGGDAVKYKQAQDFLFVNQGIFGYSAVQEDGSNTIGDDFGDFLVGNTPITIQLGAAGHRDYRQGAVAGFLQDNWRATKNLTLSLGVRYEYNSPLTDLENRVAYYRPGTLSPQLQSGALTFEGRNIVVAPGGTAPNGLVYVGDPDSVLGGTVPEGGIQLDKNNFAPRIGFAYSFDGSKGLFGRFLGENKTVIRGGVGLYYGAIIGDTALQQLNATGYNGTNAFRYHPGGTTANPFGPDPFPLYRYLGGPEVIEPLDNPFTSTANIEIPSQLDALAQPIDPLIETPEVWQFNATVERSFFKDYVLGLSYVGNRGKKLYVQEQINPALGTLLPTSLRIEGPAITTVTAANVATRRVNNDIPLSLAQLTTKGRSQYDSFEANFQKRFSDDGLTFQLAYTFSKSLNDSDTQRGNIDILDRNAAWGLSADDYPHRFVGSFIYEVPFFKNTNGFVKRLVDGWSIGGIYTYQSGSVFSVANPTDTVGTGGGVTTFADLGTGGFTLQDPKSNNLRAFNVNAFASFSCGTSFQLCLNADGTKGRRGTSGKNQFRLNNPTNNWDAILAKRVQLWNESSNLELRFEAFNLLNTVQFTTINLNLLSADFGKYTAAAQGRSIQLGARINF